MPGRRTSRCFQTFLITRRGGDRLLRWVTCGPLLFRCHCPSMFGTLLKERSGDQVARGLAASHLRFQGGSAAAGGPPKPCCAIKGMRGGCSRYLRGVFRLLCRICHLLCPGGQLHWRRQMRLAVLDTTIAHACAAEVDIRLSIKIMFFAKHNECMALSQHTQRS